VTWGEKIEIASGGGYRGPWRMNESEYDYFDATVAINEQGVVAIAWADQSRGIVLVKQYQHRSTDLLEHRQPCPADALLIFEDELVGADYLP
jgi:hypothetical protein